MPSGCARILTSSISITTFRAGLAAGKEPLGPGWPSSALVLSEIVVRRCASSWSLLAAAAVASVKYSRATSIKERTTGLKAPPAKTAAENGKTHCSKQAVGRL
jgi:hypothetical protein